MENKYGISEKSYGLILEALQNIPELDKAVIFGSRAMGNYKSGSDIDIAVYGKELTFSLVTQLHGKLNERLPIPYYIDIVHVDILKNQELLAHICQEGKVLFKKSN